MMNENTESSWSKGEQYEREARIRKALDKKDKKEKDTHEIIIVDSKGVAEKMAKKKKSPWS